MLDVQYSDTLDIMMSAASLLSPTLIIGSWMDNIYYFFNMVLISLHKQPFFGGCVSVYVILKPWMDISRY